MHEPKLQLYMNSPSLIKTTNIETKIIQKKRGIDDFKSEKTDTS